MTPSAIRAPAKINLALHVTGRRADGYHLLDSLVGFADLADVLRFAPSHALGLTVTGPMATGVPVGPENLVLRAAGLFEPGRGAAITLEKHLPHAAGLGGGSADAAAALVGLSRLWQVPLPPDDAVLALGADVPVCLRGRVARLRGIGDRLGPVPPLPACAIVLINPGTSLPTGKVFRALDGATGPAMSEPEWRDFPTFVAWLAGQRNDLEPPARALAPGIGDALKALGGSTGCALARMTGSGATCFGLFETQGAARGAAEVIAAANPDWWVRAAPLFR